jgi:hypothetical protein
MSAQNIVYDPKTGKGAVALFASSQGCALGSAAVIDLDAERARRAEAPLNGHANSITLGDLNGRPLWVGWRTEKPRRQAYQGSLQRQDRCGRTVEQSEDVVAAPRDRGMGQDP